jgi:hypothetical protein
MRPLTSSATGSAIRRRPRRMKNRRLVALAACAAVLLGASPALAAADDVNGTSIVYSDTYNKLLAAFPSGHADSCDISVVLNGGGGFCDTTIDTVYFYPDGAVGRMPWYVDASSSTGWSIEPDPCDGLSGEEYDLWAAYVDYVNGYFDSGPGLTAEQIDRYGACWGWWF